MEKQNFLEVFDNGNLLIHHFTFISNVLTLLVNVAEFTADFLVYTGVFSIQKANKNWTLINYQHKIYIYVHIQFLMAKP